MLRNLSNGIRYLLWPLSVIYRLLTQLRNFLYGKNLLSSYQSSIFTISIGNLTVGGTGKTPHIEYLIRLLNRQYQLATLSRGYGRKTKGFRQATSISTAFDIGDEPLQIYQKFGDSIPYFCVREASYWVTKNRKNREKPQVVLLDDAFQHRAVVPHFQVLLTDYGRLFYQDKVLPLGLLRESKQGAKRADVVIVTKCPMHLNSTTKALIRQK
ncbi:MAG: tetraacyldisaccharide 4'-kinase [Spirosomataceae bacterium]